MIAREAFEAQVRAWIAEGAQGFARANGRALCVGICGPQGSGKSTLCERLVPALAQQGVRACALSIDDVYLTHDEQRALSAAHPGNGYLDVRGYPGTHDVALGAATLDALVCCAAGQRVRVTSYDKGAFDGAGDRAPEASWRTLEGPFDVVLFEGWMLAFEPLAPERVRDDPAFAACNELLRAYEPWRSRVDRWVLMEAERVDAVIAWRVQAERARREREGRGMSDAQARAYIERFVPAYERWASGCWAGARGPVLSATLASDRSVLQVRSRGA